MKLIETSSKTGQYIALSHCWGHVHLIRTTSASVAERKRGIPFTELPKTFQQATMIVRRLGFRYLWIDSLCIIQDDKADWQRESALMADVYSNAALTLAASDSKDSRGGLFRPTTRLSGSTSWEISVKYTSFDDDAVRPMPRQELNASNGNSIGSPSDWLENLTEQQVEADSGGQLRSIFQFAGHREPPVVRYLPGWDLPVSLSSQTPPSNEVNQAEISETSSVSSNRNVGTEWRSDHPRCPQKPPSFRGKVECLEHSTGVYAREVNWFEHNEFEDITPEPGRTSELYLLSMRGWTLQERLLSTRILHFTGTELVWECKSATYCQCGLVGSGIDFSIYRSAKEKPEKLLKMSFEHSLRAVSQGDLKQIQFMWNKLARNFTNRTLTSNGDRLPAISGLAKRLQQAGAGEYIAGMWRNWLPQQMTWTPVPQQMTFTPVWTAVDPRPGPRWEKTTHHAANIAPTWSWASITGAIYFAETSYQAETSLPAPEPYVVGEIIDVQYAVAGLDPTGPVSHGVLTVRAPVRSAGMRQITNGDDYAEKFEILHPHTGETMVHGFHADVPSKIDTSIEDHEVLCIQWTKAADIALLLPEYRALKDPSATFSLASTCLVLRQSIETPGKYERVGLATTWMFYNDLIGYHGSGSMNGWFEGADVRMLDLI